MLTTRLIKRLPDFATEDAVVRADFTAERTDFFATAIFVLLGFLAAVVFDFDRAGLRAMESSCQWLSGKTNCRKPQRSGESAVAITARRLLLGEGLPSCYVLTNSHGGKKFHHLRNQFVGFSLR